MSYEPMDSLLQEWAMKHGLAMKTLYHDTDVRTVLLQGPQGERGQIWVDAPTGDGSVVVHAAVYRKRGRDNRTEEMQTDLFGLGSVLEQAYALVVDWLGTAA
ncbi:MAG TPA: hypothetical protein PLP01_03945 [Phycisphaerae bacterium]|nr:hypothetical protein [Phycisphaerae bacterium]HOI54378.1 hypothetical protein [Phycisphaerae bacterium]